MAEATRAGTGAIVEGALEAPLLQGIRIEVMDSKGPQPVMKPCMVMPITLDTTQYTARPAWNWVVKKPNISGIIHSIMRLVDSCRGSAAGIIVIFCIIHIDTPTSTGITGVASGSPRFIQRKRVSSGMDAFTQGSHA